MAKKLFCVFTFIFALVCVFTSCDRNANNPTTPLNSSHTHSYGEWETIKSATCTAEGSKERYCPCGDKQVMSISMTEHAFGEWTVVIAATCTEQGIEEKVCICGKEETFLIEAVNVQVILKEQSLSVFHNLHEALQHQNHHPMG